MNTRIALAALAAFLTAGVLTARQEPQQEPPPVTFRVEVNYVELDAVVTDAQGNPVTDLTVDDFEVLEDGRPQKVTAFSLVNLPIERAARPLFSTEPIEPDVQTNTNAEGRIYLIVLDDLHTTFTNTPRVKRALREFLERNFGTNDLAAVVYTSGRSGDGQDFTNNRRLLFDAVDKFLGRKLRNEVLEQADLLNRPFRDPSGGMPTDPSEMERAMQARSVMNSIGRLAEFLGGVRGRRKALLLISEGISYNIFDVITNTSANSVLQETADAVGKATRANVAIYAIDPRGLSAFDEAIEVGAVPPDIPSFSVVGSLQTSLRLSQQSLTVLAAETGGFAAVNRNDFADAFERVVRENSSYYVLGYYPTNERRDGRYRRLEVRVKRPGLTVRARRGYVAPRGRAPEATAAAAAKVSPLTASVNEAVASPIPVTGIPMTVFAAAYKGSAPNAAIPLVVELDVNAFRFNEQNETFNDRLEITFTAVDSRGRTFPGERHALSMNMKPDTVARARDRGFRIITQVDLPPGKYQLRVAVSEEGSNRAGSVLYDLEVPDFYEPPFAMSGITLTSAQEATTPTVAPKAPLSDVLPGPPTTAREFERDDEVALFAEFYENRPNAPAHRLDLTTTMRADGGRVVFEDFQERSSTDLQGGVGGYGYAVRIPLSGLAPGTYVIRVEGRTRTDAADGGIFKDMVIRIR